MTIISPNGQAVIRVELKAATILKIVGFLSNKDRIAAIKILRSAFNLSLKEAKDYIDYNHPIIYKYLEEENE